MIKQCSKCGTSFNCQNESRGCWCENLQLSTQQLAHLKENYDNCLCPKCLKEFEKLHKSPEQLCQEYSDIFSDLSDYALVETADSQMILKISIMSFVIIEEDYFAIINLMKEKGVRIVSDPDEVKPKDFVRYHNLWDEEQKAFRLISQSELNQILEERAKNKPKK